MSALPYASTAPGPDRGGRTLLVFVLATLWLLPGLWWGLPLSTATEHMLAWGTDELGPWAAVDAVQAIVRQPRNDMTPQYPLAQFLVQAIFVWPYYLPHYVAIMYPSVAGKLGLALGPPSLPILMLLHRLPSVLMGAGTVAVAHRIAERMGGAAAGGMAALAVATTGPFVYYARTSNVDAGALFWMALSLSLALDALRNGFAPRTAVALGLCAACAVATKDALYAYVLGLGVIAALAHGSTVRADRGTSGWRGPAIAFGTAAVAYLVLSGILLLPDWYWKHVRFLVRTPDPDIPQAVLTMADAYHSRPASVSGYTDLARTGGAQVAAALGWPMLALALLGAAMALRRNRLALALLLMPPVAMVLGSIVPIRLVLPRYLLPLDFALCLLAAFAVGATRHLAAPAKLAVRAMAIVALAWSGARALDITYQMMNDSRIAAADWLSHNLRTGDVVGYFGAPLKLPRLPNGVTATPMPGQLEYAYKNRQPATSSPPEFIVSIPQLGTELTHEWTVPDAAFAALFDPASGYREVLALQTPALWPRPLLSVPWINPPVRVFARHDVAARLREPARIELPDPR